MNSSTVESLSRSENKYMGCLVNLCHPNSIKVLPHMIHCTTVWLYSVFCYYDNQAR